MNRLAEDLRLALRQVRKNFTFTTVVLLTRRNPMAAAVLLLAFITAAAGQQPSTPGSLAIVHVNVIPVSA